MGAYLPIFLELLRKATQAPMGPQTPSPAGPQLTVPGAPLRTPKPSTMPSEADKINCQRKQHYKDFSAAQTVVKRSKSQDPQRQFDLHAYPCPACERGHILGHQTKYDSQDWRNNLEPLTVKS